MRQLQDEFLSEEDLDLRNMTWDEVMAYSVLWLEQAQATNDLDQHLYSHGVFEREPPWKEEPGGVTDEQESEEDSETPAVAAPSAC